MTIDNNPIPPVTRDDPAAHSGDVVGENIAALKTLFPSIITDGKVDFEVLRQLLGDQVEEGTERYGLNWKGKARARAFALTPSLGTLRPAKGDSKDWDTTKNIMIEGDNLEVLKLLRKSYAGKVKLIYIDPPYNTGKDFVYPDNYTDSLANYEKLTGQRGEDGARMTSNKEASGRFHTDWLNMMYPRLMLAKELLREDGFVFVSADQNEVAHLRQLCDELLGYENRAAEITVVNNLKGRNDKANIATTHEFLIAYSRNAEARMYGIPLSEEQKAEFKYEDERGEKYALRDLRKRGRPDRREDRPNMWFPIYWNVAERRASLKRISEDDVEITPQRGDGSDGRWRWGKERVAKFLNWLEARQSRDGRRWDFDHRVYLNNIEIDEEDDPETEDEADSIQRSTKPKSSWHGPSFSTDVARQTLKELMPDGEFSYPKPVDFVRQIVQLSLAREGLVLDFFAGSGTTGHAVMVQNAADGGNRRYILVQLPEPLDPAKAVQKTAADFCDSLGKPRNIAELTKERLRRAGEKVKKEFEAGPPPTPAASGRGDLDVGFRVYKLSSSNLKPWLPGDDLAADLLDAAGNILPGRSEEDLLVELLLKTGIDLTLPAQTREIAGCTVHMLGGGTLIVCLSDIPADQARALGDGIADWLAEVTPPAPTTFFFKDSGFDAVAGGTIGPRSAESRANLAATLRQRLGKDAIEKLGAI